MSKYKHTNESEKRGRFIRFRGNNARPPGVRILNVPWKSVIYQLNVNVCLCIQHKAKKIESIRNIHCVCVCPDFCWWPCFLAVAFCSKVKSKLGRIRLRLVGNSFGCCLPLLSLTTTAMKRPTRTIIIVINYVKNMYLNYYECFTFGQSRRRLTARCSANALLLHYGFWFHVRKIC